VHQVVRHLPPTLKRSVRSAIRALAANPKAGEPLRGEFEGLFKFRVRRYRIVYRVLERARVVRILAVGERRTVYEELAQRAQS
jgi:mRNA interferase RelE/StbE